MSNGLCARRGCVSQTKNRTAPEIIRIETGVMLLISRSRSSGAAGEPGSVTAPPRHIAAGPAFAVALPDN